MSPRTDTPVRVLIVEDAMDHALMLRSLLKGAGDFLTSHAQDGRSAIRLLDEREFDLVITDLNLPAADGFEVIRHVKERHPELPVLVVTGYTNTSYRDQAFRAGADEVLLKPLDRDDLVRKVREVMGKAEPAPDPGEEAPTGGVLAVGAYPGDVELGCGGTLMKHRARGEDVLIVVAAPERDLDDAAKAAAEAMGARIISARSAVGEEDSVQRVAELLQRIVRELRPATIYVPAPEDGHRGRRRIFEMARPTLSGVPRVLAYATATTDVAFRPVRFEDVEEAMSDKLEVLSHYRESGRRELSGRFARAAARYWGRFAEFGEVEPFAEVKADARAGASENGPERGDS